MARSPKKSETLEIRLPFEAKTAFMARCREDGVSASVAVRGFIDVRIADAPVRRVVSPNRLPWLRLAAGLVATLTVGATALPALAATAARADFDRLDQNGDARIVLTELAEGSDLTLTLGPRRVTSVAGSLDDAALAAAHDLMVRRMFDDLDRDGDGILSPGEFRAL